MSNDTTMDDETAALVGWVRWTRGTDARGFTQARYSKTAWHVEVGDDDDSAKTACGLRLDRVEALYFDRDLAPDPADPRCRRCVRKGVV